MISLYRKQFHNESEEVFFHALCLPNLGISLRSSLSTEAVYVFYA